MIIHISDIPAGVSPGCVGKCESNPCLNNGTCYERYDGYSCDCRWSAFKGPICADGESSKQKNLKNRLNYNEIIDFFFILQKSVSTCVKIT